MAHDVHELYGYVRAQPRYGGDQQPFQHCNSQQWIRLRELALLNMLIHNDNCLWGVEVILAEIPGTLFKALSNLYGRLHKTSY